MGNGIAIAGTLAVDYIKYIDSYPAEQQLTTITGIDRSSGGLCCNCALTLAKLDPHLPIQAIGIVGKDEAGDYLLGLLAAHRSMDTTGIRREGTTSYTDVMTERSTGKRTFFHCRGANALLAPGHFDFTTMDATILHIGYVLLLDILDGPDDDYPTAMCRVLDSARKAGIQTSIDVVSESGERFTRLVPPVLPYADYCVINEIEAAHTTGLTLRSKNNEPVIGNLQAACQKLIDMGVGKWAVIHMPELSCGLERGGAYVQQESWPIPAGFIKSSVGAGDAFAAGLLYGAYHGCCLRESIHAAGAIATYSLSGAGASDAIIPFPELMQKMAEISKSC